MPRLVGQPGNRLSKKSGALAVPVNVTMRRPTLANVPALPTLAAPLARTGQFRPLA